MKICLVAPNVTPYYEEDPAARYGGAEVQIAFVAEALRAEQHDVVMVVSNLATAQVPAPVFNAFNSADGIPALRFFHPRWSGVWKALRRADAELYYQRNAGMITGIAALFCRMHGRRFVFGAGSNADFSSQLLDVHRGRDEFLYRRGLRMAHGFVVQNDLQRQQVRDAGYTVPAKLIPNGVRPSPPAAASADRTVAWVGGLRKVKRPELMIELARRVPDARVVIVGGGLDSDPAYPVEMKRLAADLANVTFTGWLPHSEVQKHVHTASLLVNTSSLEGFPNVYLEAWSHGVPVVSFVDVDNLIAERNLGVICDSVDAMEIVVRRLLDQPDERRRMGERGRALVAERYSAAALGPMYTEFFAQVLGRQPKERVTLPTR